MARSQYTHEVLATTGTYKDRQTGEEKKSRIKVGRGFTDEHGNISIKMDAVPVGPEWSGWLSLYPADRDGGNRMGQERQQSAGDSQLPPGRQVSRGMPVGRPAPAPAAAPDEDDDIPF